MNEESATLRDEMRQGFSEMRQEGAAVRAEMRQGLAELGGEMGQGLAELRGEMGRGFAEVHQRIAEIRVEVGELRRDLATLTRRVDVLEDRVRANGVLLEGLRDDLRQIAEAHVMLVQRVDEYRRESDAQRTILSLLQTSYRDLDRRVTRLEERAGETRPRP
jgi:chromosome segregation ATPase